MKVPSGGGAALVAVLAAALGGCDGSTEPPGPAARAPAGVQPVPLADAPPRAPATYDFSRSQALDRVVAKLRGSTTQRAWHFAKLMLAREKGEDVARALIRYLERNLLTTGEDAPARNAIEVMWRSRSPRFAPVLLRASGHVLRTLREQALKALERCADPATAAKLLTGFARRDLRTQALLVRVAANRLPPDRAIDFLRRVILGDVTQDRLGDLRFQVLQAFELGAPSAVIRGTLAGNLGLFPGSALAVAAKQLFAAGGDEGRRTLLRLLAAAKDPAEIAKLIGFLGAGDHDASAAAVLERAFHRDARVRTAAALFLGHVAGDNAAGALEVLANDEAVPVRIAALEGLTGRSPAVFDKLLATLDTATGTRLRTVLQIIVDAGVVAAVPRITRRLDKAVGRDRRIFIQALGRLRDAAGTEPLIRVFLAPPVDLGGTTDSVSYAAIVITNILTAERRLWEVYDRLTDDVARRSHILETLANMAQAGQDEADLARRRRIDARFRRILFDPSAPVRDRIQVLHYLKTDLGLDDVARLRRLLVAGPPATRGGFAEHLNAFLWEFF